MWSAESRTRGQVATTTRTTAPRKTRPCAVAPIRGAADSAGPARTSAGRQDHNAGEPAEGDEDEDLGGEDLAALGLAAEAPPGRSVPAA